MATSAAHISPEPGYDEITRARITSQLICAWCGPVFLVLFFLALPLANLLPPPSPGLSAHQFAHQLIGNRTEFRIGLILGLAAMPLYGFVCAVLMVQMKRIEGRYSPFSYAQLGLGVLAILEVLFPFMFLLAAAFRPGRSDQLIQLLSDVALLPFVGAWMTVVFQWIATAIVIFQDKREEPIFPRWAGYLNLWVAIASVPSTLLQFVHHGPFAWNGLLSYWFAAGAFGIWILTMSILMIKAIRRQALDIRPAD
jgi:hypothetical protein